ncbi:MAG TPA: ABC transporter permease [Chloroflexota bacterium]|nr:ABC transporter permease [Chloroflexota bacterium]
MTGYVVRRLIQAVGVVVGVSVFIFCLVRLLPGDPARMMLPESASAEQVQAMRRSLGLDQPIPVQYVIFASQAVRGDLGRSLFYGAPATEVVLGHLPATLQLAGFSLSFALLVAVPVGVLSAVRRDSIWDFLAIGLALAGQSMPAFWLGLTLILVFAVLLGVLPAAGSGSLAHLILPGITLGAYLMALVTRLVRSGLLDVLNEDYVRTARAKGLGAWAVTYGHALRNVLIPLITVVGLQLGSLLGGAVITETVFAWPGVGTVLFTAINARDYPLIQASVLLLSIFFVLINLAVDLLYAYVDPRIRHA